MKKLMIFILFSVSLVCLFAVSSIAQEENLEFERNHNKQENPVTFWHFQISTPSKRSDYPPSFLWHSDRPFQDDILSPYFGNKIVIKNNNKDINY